MNHSYMPGKKDQPQRNMFVWTGKESVLNFNVDFTIPNQEFNIYGILLGMGDNSLDINVNILHRAISTKSKVVLKGILTERSSVKFNGVTRIEHGAKQTNAWLECRLLVLSDQAKGQAIPSLEILENDIKAGHASTAGRINDLEMFYLQSRGLSVRESKKLIVEGFVRDVLGEIIFQKEIKKLLNKLHYD